MRSIFLFWVLSEGMIWAGNCVLDEQEAVAKDLELGLPNLGKGVGLDVGGLARGVHLHVIIFII